VKKLGELKRTIRGFDLIEFHDYNHNKCSLQESSLATESAIWLGVDGDDGTTRMHLNKKHVKALVKQLKYWLKHEKLKGLES